MKFSNANADKHLPLHVIATMSPLSTVRICFWGLLIFIFGVIFGFYVSESLPHHTRVTRVYMAAAEYDQPQSTKRYFMTSPSKAPRKRVEFTGLPDRFLERVDMGSPSKEFRLTPWRSAAPPGPNEKGYFAIFLVKTAATNFYTRMLVRRTWGSIASINGERFTVVFLIGEVNDHFQQDVIDNESSVYGDILQGSVPDTYVGLPQKTLMGHQWITQYFQNYTKYVITTDDDCFVSVVNTYDYFIHLPPEKTAPGIHCAYIFNEHGVRVNKNTSKWYVEPQIYNDTAYPRFCHGGMIVMASGISANIYQMSLVTNYTGFHLEDVLTTGILREKLQDSKNIYSVMYKNKNRKRYPLVWHLLRKDDLPRKFKFLWEKARMRFYVDDKIDSIDTDVFNPLHAKVTLRDVPSVHNITTGGFEYSS